MSKVRISKNRQNSLDEVGFQDEVMSSVSKITVTELTIKMQPTRMLETLKPKASLEFLCALLQSPS